MALVVAVLAALGVGRWGGPWADPPRAGEPVVRPDELAEALGRPCPGELPRSENPSDRGLGTDEVARRLPFLLDPDRAWVCRYDAVETGPSADGGTTLVWSLVDPPRPVPASDLPDLGRATDGLAPAGSDGDCPADLGPRWMVVSDHDGDLTAVVVDDYGCREVRLSDDPHHTTPGDDGQDGAVGGVLQGGAPVLDAAGVTG